MKIDIIINQDFNILDYCKETKEKCEKYYKTAGFCRRTPYYTLKTILNLIGSPTINTEDPFIDHLLDTILTLYLRENKIKLPKEFENKLFDGLDIIELI